MRSELSPNFLQFASFSVNWESFLKQLAIEVNALKFLDTTFIKDLFRLSNPLDIILDKNPLPTTPTATNWINIQKNFSSPHYLFHVLINYS